MFIPPLLMRHRLRHFTVRPWHEGFGAAECPEMVLGSPVTKVLRIRHDRTAALVELVDHRYAVTGSVLAAGSGVDVHRYVVRRGARSADAEERTWFEGCGGALDDVLAYRGSSR